MYKKPELMDLNKIYHGDARKVLKTFDDKSVNCIVTSPPYYGLRDYGTGLWQGGNKDCDHRRNTKNNNPDWLIQTRNKIDMGSGDEIFKNICFKCGAKRIDLQLGLEITPEAYIRKMVAVFSEAKRVLKNDGTLWLNIGDSYNGSGKASGQSANATNLGIKKSERIYEVTKPTNIKRLKPKDLIGIPWMLAFALRKDGWYLRSEIIWFKKNPMPESVKDRPTKAHEQIFLLSKNADYYYDAEAIKEPASFNTHERISRVALNNKSIPDNKKNGLRPRKISDPGIGIKNNNSFDSAMFKMPELRNKRSVWPVASEAFPEAHFATFPQDLIIDMIKAGCPEGGIVLDPFMGAGTTGLVARKLNRNFVGIELNPAYIKLAERRLKKELGMFL